MCARIRMRGLTLIEVSTVLAIVGVVAAVAWPSQQAQLQRARRMDGITALTLLQHAQERYRAQNGHYSSELALVGSARSPDGLYLLSVADADRDRVTLLARARPDGVQGGDADCLELSLRLNQGLADVGPSGRCWNR
ncbi:MAG TPA: type IV pilin protein [Rubrivivax sp.]|nr:type IV pilin protein [Burkholderiales bacterium]HNU10548.1 type IV pilin protein [Rubrivivax sp.]